ncbi:hypothetical protein K2Q16_02080 [Patescibacteria group bacterium]|nr:hypothetical protein [Patescibacteria group bacterium]
MSAATASTLRISSYGSGRFELRDLSSTDIQILDGSFRGGFHWVRRGDDGRLEHVPFYKALPAAAEDASMHPFWQAPVSSVGVQMEMFPLYECGDTGHRFTDSSIIIQSLCGYEYTEDRYRSNATILEECGFVCLRSRRDPQQGQFWELWFLPGTWAAAGKLRAAIKASGANTPNEKTKAAVEFLQTHVRFGTLDVSVQRLALTISD